METELDVTRAGKAAQAEAERLRQVPGLWAGSYSGLFAEPTAARSYAISNHKRITSISKPAYSFKMPRLA